MDIQHYYGLKRVRLENFYSTSKTDSKNFVEENNLAHPHMYFIIFHVTAINLFLEDSSTKKTDD